MTLYSHKLLADKYNDFVLGLHVSDEIKYMELFFLFINNQYFLLHCVNSLKDKNERWENRAS